MAFNQLFNQLVQFEDMNDIQRIQAIESILMAHGAKRIEKTSRRKKNLSNIFYLRQGVPYVFVVIINRDKGYYTWTLIDYSTYQEIVVKQNQIFRAEQCHHEKKWSIQYGAANVRVHDFVLPNASAVDHVTGCKLINIKEMLRPCNAQENMKNVLRYCTVDKRNKSFYMKDPNTTAEDRIRLGQLGFTIKHLSKGDYIYSPSYNTLGECYTMINQFEQHYFGAFAFNPLMNFEYTWYALILQKMLGCMSDLELMQYNRSYWIRKRAEDAEYYML